MSCGCLGWFEIAGSDLSKLEWVDFQGLISNALIRTGANYIHRSPNGLFQIGHNIGYIFDSNGYTYQTICYSILKANFLWHSQV